MLKVITSDYPEFPVGSYWTVENITSSEVPGSTYAVMSAEAELTAVRGMQPIIMEYELEVSKSVTDVLGKPRV